MLQWLSMIKEEGENVPTALAQQVQRVAQLVYDLFGWQVDSDLEEEDEDGPVVVDSPADF